MHDSRRSLAALLVAILIVALTPSKTFSDDADTKVDPRIERAIKMLDSGRDSKALKQLDKLRAEQPELEPDILCALAASSNRRLEYEKGLAEAQACAAQATSARTIGQARVELLVATVATGEQGEELATRLSAVREFLAERQDDELTDAIRVQLCFARELLPDSHPSSLANAAPPTGKIRFLPGNDPSKGLHSVQPIRIRERLVNQEFEGVARLSGRIQARFESTIDADGCFAAARLSDASHEIFEGPALKAVRGWVYRPPRLNGEAVAMHFAALVFMEVFHR